MIAGRRHAPQNPLFVLVKAGPVVAIRSLRNRLADIDRHPFLVFGERRVRLLQIAEFTRFVRRTRHAREQCGIFGCFRSVLLRGEHLMGPFRDGESTIRLSPGSAWIRFIGGERHVGDDQAN